MKEAFTQAFQTLSLLPGEYRMHVSRLFGVSDIVEEIFERRNAEIGARLVEHRLSFAEDMRSANISSSDSRLLRANRGLLSKANPLKRVYDTGFLVINTEEIARFLRSREGIDVSHALSRVSREVFDRDLSLE